MARSSKKLSLRALLASLGAVGLILVLVAGAVTYFSVERVSRETEEVAQVYEPAATASNTLTLATSDMERGISLYSLSGDEELLLPYVSGERQSEIAIEEMRQLLPTDPLVSPLIAAVSASRAAWLTDVAEPVIAETRDANQRKARQILTSEASLANYEQFVTDGKRVNNQIEAELIAAFDELSSLTSRLALLQGIGIMVLLVAVLMAWLLLHRRVLEPLDELRMQMRAVARDRELQTRITPSGPGEIQAVGRDAEQMRRQLVDEIENAVRADEEARRATESLDRNAPVVAAIMHELGSRTDALPEKVEVYGEIHAAETVLAGDFWDCVSMPGGRTAVVIVDVAGHGDVIGVAATRMKHLLAVALASGRSPASALEIAARRLSDENEPTATAAIIAVDPGTQTVEWANAGHHPPFLLQSTGAVTRLERTGPLLSWMGGPWGVKSTDLHAGDRLILFSDGLVESHDQAGEELGSDGLLRLWRQAESSYSTLPALVRGLLTLGRERAVDWARDDVTLVALSLQDSSPE